MLAKCNIEFATHKASITVDGDLERIQCFKHNQHYCEWESFDMDQQDQVSDFLFRPLEQFRYVVTWHDQ